jgi:hypothetical protein
MSDQNEVIFSADFKGLPLKNSQYGGPKPPKGPSTSKGSKPPKGKGSGKSGKK